MNLKEIRKTHDKSMKNWGPGWGSNLKNSEVDELLHAFEEALELLRLITPDKDDDLTWSDGAGWHCDNCDKCAAEGEEDEFEHREGCWTTTVWAFLAKHSAGTE